MWCFWNRFFFILPVDFHFSIDCARARVCVCVWVHACVLSVGLLLCIIISLFFVNKPSRQNNNPLPGRKKNGAKKRTQQFVCVFSSEKSLLSFNCCFHIDGTLGDRIGSLPCLSFYLSTFPAGYVSALSFSVSLSLLEGWANASFKLSNLKRLHITAGQRCYECTCRQVSLLCIFVLVCVHAFMSVILYYWYGTLSMRLCVSLVLL